MFAHRHLTVCSGRSSFRPFLKKSVSSLLMSAMFLSTDAFPSIALEDFKGTWGGVEVVGVDFETAKRVRNILPIQKGEPFSFDQAKFNQWCNLVRENIQPEGIDCNFVGYLRGEYYYVVELVLKGGAKRRPFRTIPANVSKKSMEVSPRLQKLYSRQNDLYFSLFQAGVAVNESNKQGYLDYTEPELHVVVQDLIKYVPQEGKHLLQVIQYSPDPAQRSMAATLLNWSMDPGNIAAIIRLDLLNDPDENVRNNLSRYLSFNVGKIEDETLIKEMITAFCEQVKLPSHGDRNKALFSLSDILRSSSSSVSYLNSQCRDTIISIGKTSILDNVGGIAKELEEAFKNNNG